MRMITTVLAASALLAVAACDNKTDDVVQVPANGGVAQEVTEERADLATAQTALALGLTRKQLEDADLVSPAGVDLGDVDSLVLDPAGAVTHFVVDVDGPNDVKVLVPLDRVTAHTAADGSKDLQTTLSVTELLALPKYTPAA